MKTTELKRLVGMKQDSLTAWLRDYGTEAGFAAWWTCEVKRHTTMPI